MLTFSSDKKKDDKSNSKSKPSKKDNAYKNDDERSLGPDDSVSCIPNFGDYRHKKEGSKSWDHMRPSSNDRIEMSGGRGNGSFKSRPISPGPIEMQRVSQRRSAKDSRRNQWTEIDKNLAVKEAIEALNYEYEERNDTYYIFSYLDSVCIPASLLPFSPLSNLSHNRMIYLHLLNYPRRFKMNAAGV